MPYLLFIVGGLVLFALYLRWREPSMIYYPTRDQAATPDQAGLPYAEVWLTTTDHVRIHAWFIKSVGAGVDHGEPRPADAATILFLHGNAGNISHRLEKLTIFHRLGVNVLIIDYRGYGQSAGEPNETGTYADARAAYDYLLNTEHLKPKTLLLYGESLGSAIAVELATRVPVGGVILEEPFTSVGDVGQRMFPFLPVRWLVRNKYDSLSKIARINAPLLIFHSRDDEIFPIRHAQRLLATARKPKQLIELRGGHNDAFLASADTYRQGLRESLRSLH